VGGPENQTQGQLLGKHTFRYAIHPHAGDWESAMVWEQAWGHNLPLRTMQTTIHDGTLPTEDSYLNVDGATVVVSTMKKADGADKIVTRVFNIGDTAADDCTIEVANTGTTVFTNLNEEILDGKAVGDGSVTINIPAKRIITLAGDVKKG
ncbi:MAG: glycosyl hydrolase-related protein, partial [Armatimonadota bacterium]